MLEGSTRRRLRHVAGLDGIRAAAVMAVIAGHSGFSWLPGGFYGVDAFFVLSGFLITTLLINEWQDTGAISLGAFWSRRARRLLPALFTLIIVMGVVLRAWPNLLQPPSVEGALATIFYSANWYLIGVHANYFVATGQPSPLLHTWSLAIEEQFYLVWPLVVLLVLRFRPHTPRRALLRRTGAVSATLPVVGHDDQVLLVKRRRGTPREPNPARRLEWLFTLASAGALASAIEMAYLAPSGSDTTRAYYGTDTRAQALLVGAALAAALAALGSRAHQREASGARSVGAGGRGRDRGLVVAGVGQLVASRSTGGSCWRPSPQARWSPARSKHRAGS